MGFRAGVIGLGVFLAVWCNAAASSGVFAEPGQWYLSPLAGAVRDDTERNTDFGYNLQLGIGRQLDEVVAFEVYGLGTLFDGKDQYKQWGLGLDLLVGALDPQRRVRPYFVLGTGYMSTQVSEGPQIPGQVTPGDSRNGFASVGAGITTRIGNGGARFRGELRYRPDFADPTFNDVLINLGAVFPLGRSRSTGPIDGDGDGVPDDRDLCPDTPAGAAVDGYGCELDSDGDGVVDSADRCPDTPRGAEVDATGCGLDDDGDGVPNTRDECPDTPRSVQVGEDGCELDSDGDGVVDTLDSCPDTRPGARVDVRGCEIREAISLPGVGFRTGEATLLADSAAVLDRAARTLLANPDLRVEAAGHTDTTGAAAVNQALSQRRAEAVRDYLISRGVAAERISARGYGETSPIADNSTAAGRERNRRVELRVLN